MAIFVDGLPIEYSQALSRLMPDAPSAMSAPRYGPVPAAWTGR